LLSKVGTLKHTYGLSLREQTFDGNTLVGD
jgi:hypothetical protein